jgi:hypothetical protein
MTHYIVPWSPLTATGSTVLAVVLFVVTGVLIFVGTRIRQPLAAKRPGRFVGLCLVVIWLVAVITFLAAATTYGLTLQQQLGGGPVTGPANYITPITIVCGFVAFLVILYLTSSSGTRPSEAHPISLGQFWVAIGSALLGTIAAPLIFELPFDLLVMWRVTSPTPRALFIVLYFFPLFIIEISSLAMLTFSPFMRVSRLTLFLLAGMFLIFAVWAVFGFAYPSTPLPYACNATSKILAFAAAVSLFLPQKSVAK